MKASARVACIARRHFRGLWRVADFRRLWLSLTITSFCAQITNLALPTMRYCASFRGPRPAQTYQR